MNLQILQNVHPHGVVTPKSQSTFSLPSELQVSTVKWAVWRYRRLVAGASRRKRGFDSRPAHVHFVVDIAPSSSRFFSHYRSISISYTYFIWLPRRHIILGIDSVVKQSTPSLPSLLTLKCKSIFFNPPLSGMDLASKNPVPCAKCNQNHERFHPTPGVHVLAICDMLNDQSLSCQLMLRAGEDSAEVSVGLIGGRRGRGRG